jgi:hypothetical protein
MEIIIDDNITYQLEEIAKALIKDWKYKSYEDKADEYVDKIYDKIFEIPHLPHYKCLTKKLGNYFIRHTVKSGYIYYIVFDKKGDRYYIENIIGSSDSRRHRHIAGTK